MRQIAKDFRRIYRTKSSKCAGISDRQRKSNNYQRRESGGKNKARRPVKQAK